MPVASRTLSRFLLVGCVALLPGCDETSSFTPPNTAIATIEVTGCGAVAATASCPITARAWNSDGEEIENPSIVWSSSRPHIATVVSTAPGEARINGITAGTTEIKASDATRRVSASITVRVAALRHPPEG
ncbi:MAG: hypothetical protein R3326_06660 [Gemmatimonadota bacterium]|nr:hypothetical protein [Gemmatimonadota bacterium]